MTRYAFLDLETTGIDSLRDSIIEVAILLTDEEGNEIQRIDKLVFPEKSPLTPSITKITGITEMEIRESGIPLKDIKKEVENILTDAIFVGHNVDFDIDFLQKNELAPSDIVRIDTHELSRILLVNEKTYALEGLSKRYGISHENAHRAMSDVLATKQLFFFLVQKISELPFAFLKDIQEKILQKTHWKAKDFFFGTRGALMSFSDTLKEEIKDNDEKIIFSEEEKNYFLKLDLDYSLFIRAGDSDKTSEYLLHLARSAVGEGQKVLIISPKIDFFPGVKKFPIPEVIFSSQRFFEYLESREFLTEQETVFFLKCAYRHFLGHRGRDSFDLFFEERDLWQSVNLLSEEDPLFQQILEERASENILLLTPDTFLRFYDLPLFQNRILFFDEAELFAERLLFFPVQKTSLSSLLQSENKEISVATQFFITHFCQEVFEKKLDHALTPFPERITFSEGEIFPQFAKNLREISPDFYSDHAVRVLLGTDLSEIRWANYFPEKGDLSFESWKREDWEKEKRKLSLFRKVFFFRHKPRGNNSFFRLFLGSGKGEFIENRTLFSPKKWIIPQDLISAQSPLFNSFTAQKIQEIALDLGIAQSLAVLFTSLDTIRKIFEEIYDPLTDKSFLVLGEKVMGGDGKLLQKLENAPRAVVLLQKLFDPELLRHHFEKIVFQKFPFPLPHPVLSDIDQYLKTVNLSLWDMWTVPFVSASLSRKISIFPFATEIIWLDPRENSAWGEEILSAVRESYHDAE